MGAPSFLSGVLVRPIRSEDGSGMLKWSEIQPALHLNQPYYASPTGLICLENTHNFAGGSVMTAAHSAEICERAHELGLPVHLDGARIFNASAALNESVAELSKNCDSVQFCLSKALGAPVGSMLVGARDFIDEARIWRKRLGGGMRQVGVLAAAGLVALEETPQILRLDHENARFLAEGLADLRGVLIDLARVVTNIVIFDISATGKDSVEIVARLKDENILAIGFGKTIRMVTHYDVSRADMEKTVGAMKKIIGE
jgi:threonine aldolase